MKKDYISPRIKTMRLAAPALMLDMSVTPSSRDDENSDRSKAFWGSTVFDNDAEVDAAPEDAATF